MEWVCRESTYFRSKVWNPGDVIDVISDAKWVYSGGGWVQQGAKVVDPKKGEFISRFFEPTDLSVLASPKDVYAARERRTVLRDWLYPHEVKEEDKPKIDELPEPKPLKPAELKKPRAEKQKLSPAKVKPT